LLGAVQRRYGILIQVAQHVASDAVVFLLVCPFRFQNSLQSFPLFKAVATELVWIRLADFVSGINVIKNCFQMKGIWTINAFYFEKQKRLEELQHISQLSHNPLIPFSSLTNIASFNKDDFMAKDQVILVDVYFKGSGWYCGNIARICATQVWVNFVNGDESKRLVPQQNEIRLCRHVPQVGFATK
jgi:hypothetical protein